jgi:HAMP domain-containing protein
MNPNSAPSYPEAAKPSTPFRRIFERMPLRQKLASLLALTFLISIAFVIGGLNILFSNYADQQINAKASHLLDSMTAVRSYTAEQIDPILSKLSSESESFLPQAVPFYSSQEVFSILKRNPEFTGYKYREAALNPTNPKDKADSQEAKLINSFRSNTRLTMLEGRKQTAAGTLHYIARPIKLESAKCLSCHSTHQEAPSSLVNTYGKANGFGWQLGEVVGAQILTVPVEAILEAKRRSLGWVGLLNTAAFLATAAVLLLFLGRAIIRPMQAISVRAYEASIHPEKVDFREKQRQDEIGQIAQSFDRMKQSLAIAMRMIKNPGDNKPRP